MRRLLVAQTAATLIVFVCALTGSSAASAGHPAVVGSTDERFVMVSGKDRDGVLVVVNEAAARGYRLVAVSTEWSSIWGMTGLICLLERNDDEKAPARAYRFRQGLNMEKLKESINTDASQGFRVMGWSILDRHADYVVAQGSVPFVVMEHSPQPETVEHAMIVVHRREKLLKALQQHCEQHYRLAAFLGRGGQVIVIMERPVETSVPSSLPDCDNERFEFIEEKDYSELAGQLDDLASKGYGLLAAANRGFMRHSFKGGAILLERMDGDSGKSEYVFLDPGQEIPKNLEALNAAGDKGFRLHRLTGGLLIMEKPPGTDARSEYRLVTGESAPQLLDAVSASSSDGFRAVRLCCDGMVLLERQQPSQ